ncbi:MAG: hypothetical protein V7K69_20885 [Nostoc sp.]|uniref:hypothetical protein n=1 Tax=Nostoc sp. TaxID=1180 RepID=UPI002FF9B267
MAVKSKKSKKTKTKSKSCPTCGSVECFERPRFFGGQMLTDKDLDAAQRYVIEKNRLHNRYLVGTGVACGLAVRCDPCCDGSVIIEAGYAIDCCGNDIVVCQEASFNVLDCFKQQKETPYCDRELIEYKSQCDRESKEYCLAIFYDEEPSQPVTALIRDNGCKNVRCEPSRIRETFHFELVEKPEPDRCNIDLSWLRGTSITSTNNASNPIIQILKTLAALTPSHSFLCRVLTCLFEDQEFLNIVQEFQTINNSGNFTQEALQLFNRMRSYVLKLYEKEPRTRCDLLAEIKSIAMPIPEGISSEDYNQQAREALGKMFLLILQLVLDCICDALLVPGTECNEEEGIILACLTIKEDKIEKICNISRKQLITGPALQYWIQPLFAALAQIAESLCCNLDISQVIKQLNIRGMG